MEGRPATAVRPIFRIEGIEPTLVVEMIDNVGNVAFEAILFDPLRDVLRQEVLLILVVSNEVGRHGWILTFASCPLYRSQYEQMRRSRPDVRRDPSITCEEVRFLGKSVELSTSRRSGRDSGGPQQMAVAARQSRFDRSEAAQASP